MTTLTEIKGFQAFQEAMDREIREASEGFVRIGYLLKVARDTEVLRESGFKSVTEFASSRYGLTPDIVSRYMAINDRFSEGGYSDRLKEQYQPYGVTKLAEMLTLSDEVIEAIPAEATRQEIREIKAEIAEEMQKTDLEVMMEEPEIKLDTLAQQVLYQYFDKMPERYPKVFTAAYQPDAEEALLEALAPTGTGMAMVRVEGKGKLMFSIDGREISIVNVRSQIRTEYTPKELLLEVRVLCPIDKTPGQAWQFLYNRPMETEKELEAPKPVEILTKKPERKAEKPKRQPEKPKTEKAEEHSKNQPSEKSGMKSSETLEESGISEQLALEPESETKESTEEIAPAQEWLKDLKTCYERALKAAEEGRWPAWDGYMIQAKNIANVIRKAQEDKEIPGQMTLGGINE
jgi:hypothetical protein|nr:MAG TPA: hypothetical protein [Caudoviricetes sp.]